MTEHQLVEPDGRKTDDIGSYTVETDGRTVWVNLVEPDPEEWRICTARFGPNGFEIRDVVEANKTDREDWARFVEGVEALLQITIPDAYMPGHCRRWLHVRVIGTGKHVTSIETTNMSDAEVRQMRLNILRNGRQDIYTVDTENAVVDGELAQPSEG